MLVVEKWFSRDESMKFFRLLLVGFQCVAPAGESLFNAAKKPNVRRLLSNSADRPDSNARLARSASI